MALPPRLDQTPTLKELERALGSLSTNALRKWWILEAGRSLMGLDSVRAGLPSDATEGDYALALRRYLETAVDRVESPQRRSILEIVLGAGDARWKSGEWRSRTARERREEAGRLFRASDRPVTAGTIRQHHEPRAIRDLAMIVLGDEQRARGELLDGDEELGLK